jgi:hypothetical protein
MVCLNRVKLRHADSDLSGGAEDGYGVEVGYPTSQPDMREVGTRRQRNVAARTREEQARKRGRPRLPDEMVSADGLRMRKVYEARRAAKASGARYHPKKRALKPQSEYARAEFRCLLPTVENRRCGFAESEAEPWHWDFMRKMRRRYLTFFHERGMRPPPVSRVVLMT